MTRIVDPEGREAVTLDALVDLRDKEVIDVGCGEGRTTRYLARTAVRVLGVDPDKEALARALDAGDEGDRITFLDAEVVALDLPPGSFDVAVFSRSL